MLVFEATDQFQGQRQTDYHHATTGELVYLPLMDCSNPECGCTRGFAGFNSHRATTTAKIVERQDYTVERLASELRQSLDEGGWIDALEDPDFAVSGLTTEIVEMAQNYADQFGIGTVVEREGEYLQRRFDLETLIREL